ncbi:UBP1-associated proteins 1C [Punica granatum]|uniref:U1-type domain-containing protein n=2 Tax=Punica granatum TaxID=22663 RepID=A0A218XDQ0_PUNGR|nr:UBP1-associated proteins 1C [Punica granatum]OWM83077.1 hypothetical protein CDL15_Pgr011759 [Punica granatum]PKI45815.1 hypothetical protein CRG98_033822 [Punica granatum]
MVWFQCEDCGENLKKPKLPNHFRICSASRLSCIDCGETFGQQSVQGHTQCITEAEKYGPKGQGKALNGTPGKQINKDSKQQQPDFDIKVGLSKRPPWFCSLCNTKATSEQTLLLHADGKKHRAKARAFHASKRQPQQKEESTPQTTARSENPLPANGTIVEEPKVPHSSETGRISPDKLEKDNRISPEKRKRKRDDSQNGEVIQADGSNVKGRKIKWKKLIESALKSNPDKPMKIKKLKKLLFGAAKEMGKEHDENTLSETLQQKLNSSSRFIVEGKYVRLVQKDWKS